MRKNKPCKHWTPEEINQLFYLHDVKRISIAEIAILFDRTEDSVRKKYTIEKNKRKERGGILPREKIAEFIKENYQKYTNLEIATMFNVSLSYVQRFKTKNGLTSQRSKQSKIQSICWECDNAYAHKCDWIKRMKKIWNDAITIEDCIVPGTLFYKVTNCDHFIPDKK